MVEKINIMKVISQLRTYPENAGEKRIEVVIKSHGSFRDRVIVEIEGKEYVLIAHELQKSIDNATNN
jgi:hypothetical protein